MKRRTVLGLIASSLVSRSIFAASLNPRIALLQDLVDAIGAAGDAISKLTDGVAHLVVTSVNGYNYLAAVRERNRLIDISSRTAFLIAQKNVMVIDSIESYLRIQNPTPEQWSAVTTALNMTLTEVLNLLNDVREERGDFVLQPAYLSLNISLNSRAAALQQLSTLSPPTTPEERQLLQQASDKYKILISNAKKAVTELNKYVEQTKP